MCCSSGSCRAPPAGCFFVFFFFFNAPATTEIYTLPLHDALPIWKIDVVHLRIVVGVHGGRRHEPFEPVNGLADFVELPLEFERIGAESVTHRVVTLDRK